MVDTHTPRVYLEYMSNTNSSRPTKWNYEIAKNYGYQECDECGHEHFYTAKRTFVECPQASEGCDCEGQD